MKNILKLIDNIQVTIDENIENDIQRNYAKNCLLDVLEEIRNKQDLLKKQESIITNYSQEINRLRFTIKGLGNSFKYLISNFVDE